jgi:hypothetical protein
VLTREVFPDAEAGDSDYRLAERFFDRYEGDWFKIDRRDGSPWVEPTPEACRRASLDTTGKHTVETQDSDGTADDTQQSEAEANAQSFLRRRRTIEDDAERGHLLGEFARKRQATEDRFHAFEDSFNPGDHLLVPYATRFNSERRVADTRERYGGAWERATEAHDVAVVATLTTDPARYPSIEDACEDLLEDVNRLITTAVAIFQGDRTQSCGRSGNELQQSL